MAAGDRSNPPPPRLWSWWVFPLSLAIVAVLWCTVYNRWSLQAWTTPVSYEGDSWGTLAALKAFATGEILPLLPKSPKSLGAPLVANWNDYPITEEGTLAWLGFLARIFGLFAGANAGLLAAHLLAAVAFLGVCRHLRYELFFSMAAAMLFALSPFSFWRAFSHITVNYYWHVPLGLLVIYWCLQPELITGNRRKLWLSVAIALIHGCQNPYYTGLFAQFLVCTAFVLSLGHPGWRRARGPLLLAGILLATFLVMNLDTLIYSLREGPNPGAVNRSYAELEHYALKPVELLLPARHSLPAVEAWTNRVYLGRAYVLGEVGSPYLGIVGIFALGLLFWSATKALALQDFNRLPRHIWCVLWILAFSVIGGLNSVLGLGGLILFRSSNRYSIVILAVLLLFLVRQLSSWTRRWPLPLKGLSAALIATIGLFDQVPARQPAAEIAAIHRMIEDDAQFVAALEKQLPPGAMIFQMPVMEFPEVEPILGLADYEDFRPYLFSQHLRFSYGSDKGRLRERWQREAQSLGPARLVQFLENYGFSSVLIARDAYVDRGASLQENLRTLGREKVLAESQDSVAIELQPNPKPQLPPVFNRKWSPLESNETHYWRWTAGRAATVAVDNPNQSPRAVHLRFGFETVAPRRLEVSVNGSLVHQTALDPQTPANLADVAVTLQPGPNLIRFESDVPGTLLPGAETIKRSFALVNFTIDE